MKTILFAGLLLASAAKADVFTCPDAYPKKEAPLSEVPYQHTGSGIVRGAALSGAYLYTGKLFEDPNSDGNELVPKAIKGGWQAEDNFTPDETKWLVCLYGGDEKGARLIRTTGAIEWWEKIDPKMTHCVLRVMKTKLTYTDTLHLTATAICR